MYILAFRQIKVRLGDSRLIILTRSILFTIGLRTVKMTH